MKSSFTGNFPMKKTAPELDATTDLPSRRTSEESAIVRSVPPEKDASSEKGRKKEGSRRVGLVLGSGPSMSQESQERLRTRLQLSALLLGSGLCVYLIIKLFNLFQTSVERSPLIFWAHLAITVAHLGVAWRLSVRCKTTLRHLRVVEFIVFGGTALFFVLVSHAVLADSIKAGFVTDITPPWLLMIFTYALLIPNTWQRAALVIIPLALIPIGLALSVRLTTEDFTAVMQTDPMYRNTMIRIFLGMIWGSATAIWGVWSIRSLRREAFEAKKMGQYQLKKLLGRGGMGEVYLAEHRMLKRPCALKLIRPDVADIRLNLKRFEREVQSTARLTHWNTVEIYDYGNTEDGVFYYVMEYLPGMNLDDVVRMNGPFPANRAIYLLKQVCEALAEAHCEGLIHRDIKPANIFSARRGGMYDVAKLLDFGLVRQTGLTASPDDDVTREGAITGSPLYMSPEQALGEVPDERSDIYSLGAVAYYLTAGRPPFVDENPMRVIMSHAHDVPTPPSVLNPDIPLRLEQVIMKCLEKKPEDRFANVRLLLRALIDSETEDLWNAEKAAHWWKHHGCPHKKKLDAEVLELSVA
jgi:serine/threonine-protein kinase